MLTSCPKCGFSQPKDQYCAQCGIDMSAYRPPEKSLFQKLSENLFVQLAFVVLIGLFAVLMVTKNHKQSFWTRVQFLRGSSSTQISQSKEANQFSSTQEQTQNPQMDEVKAVQNQDITTPIAETKPKALPTGSHARIYYLEVPQNILSKWLEEGILTRVETSEGITIGYIPQLSQALEQYKSQIKVLKEESYNYNLNQLYTAKLEKPAAATDNTTLAGAPPSAATGRTLATTETTAPGIVTYATLDDDRNETLTGQLEVSVSPQTSFPAQFEMSADQSFFISGFDKSRTRGKSAASETVVVLKIDK
jgi:hypothetical protein